MRLQLIAFATCLATAHADPELGAGARVAIYHDSDATTVTTSSVAASANIARDVRIDAQYLVDVVSSASVDVVTAATARIHDTRHEVTGGISAYGLRASYIRSTENDWNSHTLGLAASRGFIQHNLTLGVGVSFATNRIGRDGYPMYRTHLQSGGGDAFASYALSPRDLVSLAVGVVHLDGEQASPYRFVVYGNLRAAYEVVPRSRTRQAVTLRWNHALFQRSALRTHIRLYRDTWGVVAMTGGADYSTHVDALDLGVRIRGHAQRGARFYREHYSAAEPFMTADKELSTLRDVFGGVFASYLVDRCRFDLALDVFRFAYDDYAAMQSRTGMVVSFGVALER